MNNKKLIILFTLVLMVVNAMAQNVYSLCDYHDSIGYYAGVALNGQLLYKTVSKPYSSGYSPITVICDANGDVFWLMEEDSHFRWQIWKNGEFLSQHYYTCDLFLYNDEVLCAGYDSKQTSEGTYIDVAVVRRCSDNSIYWELGDGVHPSRITDVEVDKQTGIPYFCGEIIDGKRRAVVWKGQELFYQCPDIINNETLEYSYATEISVDSGDVYARIKVESASITWCIMKNGNIVHSTDAYNIIDGLTVFKGNLYYCLQKPIQNEYYLAKKIDDQEIQIIDFYADGPLFKPYKTHHFSDDLMVVGQCNGHGRIWRNGEVSCLENSTTVYDVFIDTHFIGQEWYYEILNDDGSITYQHLEYAADTTIGTQRPKIIIRSNTQYDRDTIITEVTHEYIYEENGIVYWWNKDLEEFTTLYDLTADVGDEWEIKVGTESLTMHVDAVENYEYEDKTYRMLHVSDEDDLFSGDIVCGIGHLTSFFPERLMNRGKGYSVTSLRCYWVEGNLVFKINRDDCDAIYTELHHGLDETMENGFVVYPNPANDVLFVETRLIAFLQTQTYRITNLVGQTVLSGNITTENQQINIESLPEGLYFISVGERIVKFMKR